MICNAILNLSAQFHDIHVLYIYDMHVLYIYDMHVLSRSDG